MKSFIFPVVFFILMIFGPLQADDYFITAQPDAYQMLDGYQQKLSNTFKRHFARNSAWLVLKKQMLLSDGFTKVMKVRGTGAVYYFVLNREGSPLKQATSRDLYINNAAPLLDTLLVALDKTVLFSADVQKGKGARTYLQPGEKIIRLFRWKGAYYIRPISANSYGWLTLLNKNGLKKQLPHLLPLSNSRDKQVVLKQLEEKTTIANKFYARIFKVLASHFQKYRQAPYWQIQEEAGGWDIIFMPEDYRLSFAKSRHYFAEKIRSVLWKSGYGLINDKNTLQVRRMVNDEK